MPEYDPAISLSDYILMLNEKKLNVRAVQNWTTEEGFADGAMPAAIFVHLLRIVFFGAELVQDNKNHVTNLNLLYSLGEENEQCSFPYTIYQFKHDLNQREPWKGFYCHRNGGLVKVQKVSYVTISESLHPILHQ